jgi:hypothetical protein
MLLQMRLLRSMRSIPEASIRNTLSELPQDLNEAYCRLLNDISKDFPARALLALKWIVLALRPIFIEELVEVCVLKADSHPESESGSSRLQGYNSFELLQDLIIIEPPLPIDSLSSSVRERTHIIALAHVSVVEYLMLENKDSTAEHSFRFGAMDGQGDIARSCISFIFHFNKLNLTAAKCTLLNTRGCIARSISMALHLGSARAIALEPPRWNYTSSFSSYLVVIRLYSSQRHYRKYWIG